MSAGKVFILFVVLGAAWAYGPGDYVPKSYYVIDHNGHQSNPVYIRSRRGIMDHPFFRVKRGGAHSSSGSTSGGGYYGPDPSEIIGQVQNILNNIPSGGGAGGAGARSFASSGSSGSGSGYGSGKSYGGLGSGQDSGYHGPVLFSRFGEAEGSGVHVSGQAAGPNAAFSSSSSSVDDKGKIRYSVQSGKY